jgi:radical SAM superfamily enzyme YgiQ (UPF0313 family)
MDARSVNRPLTVGLVQINNSFSGQNYLPYSAGVLQAYAEANAKREGGVRFLLPIYKRIPAGQAIEHLLDADIAGFSTYVWNHRISLEVARRLKARRPDILIAFGGPQVPDKPEAYLRAHPFIDVAIHNEGEKTFVALLDRFPGRDWSDLPGVSFIAPDGRYVRNPNGPRIRDLSEVPSPFLGGAFDPLMAANPNEAWIGLWETNRGCPFQCTFCDWGSAIAAKVNQFEIDRLKSEVEWFAARKIEFVFCCDANFGILKRDVEIAEYVAEVKRRSGYPRALSVQNTKNATDRAYLTQKILSDAGLNKGVALSMQSLDATTLANIKRDNISLETYMELQRRFRHDKVETYSDLILGLPGETYESFRNGVDRLIENGQHNRIQFNNLSILPNAEMGDPDYLRKFGMETVESAIINIHGARQALPDDVEEVQQLVVATASMPRADWRRTRAFGWMTAFLHFDKLLQIPLIVAHEMSGLPYRDAIEAFLEAQSARWPLLGRIATFFAEEAGRVQAGGPEYVYSPEWLGIYWPADEYMFIRLTAEKSLERFYDEAGRLLGELVAARAPGVKLAALDDAVRLNRALIKQPFVRDDVTLELGHDVMVFYLAVLEGESAALVAKPTRMTVRRSREVHDDFQIWCREVVWWGNKKGAYLYGNHVVEKELEGHY